MTERSLLFFASYRFVFGVCCDPLSHPLYTKKRGRAKQEREHISLWYAHTSPLFPTSENTILSLSKCFVAYGTYHTLAEHVNSQLQNEEENYGPQPVKLVDLSMTFALLQC